MKSHHRLSGCSTADVDSGDEWVPVEVAGQCGEMPLEYFANHTTSETSTRESIVLMDGYGSTAIEVESQIAWNDVHELQFVAHWNESLPVNERMEFRIRSLESFSESEAMTELKTGQVWKFMPSDFGESRLYGYRIVPIPAKHGAFGLGVGIFGEKIKISMELEEISKECAP